MNVSIFWDLFVLKTHTLCKRGEGVDDTLAGPLRCCVGANNHAMVADDCGRVLGTI